ncbi:MAG: Holliday junction branch migration protein RuvA [Planctomycetota bacterium]
MFDFVTGVVTSKRPDAVVINVSGVGYSCSVSLKTLDDLPAEGDVATLLLHLHVASDELSLYGFSSSLERELFRRLISVSGVGPRLAMALLSGITPPDLVEAIASENVARLSSIRRVGPKTAQRIVVDLGDYVRRRMKADALVRSDTLPARQEEAVAALVALGYKEKAAFQAVDKAMKKNTEASVEALVKEALRGS